MNLIISVLIQTCAAFIATVSFSFIFNVPRKELLFAGGTGALGWALYQIIITIVHGNTSLASFTGAATITLFSRIFSVARKMPATIYLVAGILPLVPGANLYYTMYELIITGNNAAASANGVEALKTAGVIAVGIMAGLSLPKSWFGGWHVK